MLIRFVARRSRCDRSMVDGSRTYHSVEFERYIWQDKEIWNTHIVTGRIYASMRSTEYCYPRTQLEDTLIITPNTLHRMMSEVVYNLAFHEFVSSDEEETAQEEFLALVDNFPMTSDQAVTEVGCG